MISTILSAIRIIVLGMFLFCVSTWAGAWANDASQSCTDDGRKLDFAFYAFFEPVSYRVDSDSASGGFNTHRGYEADLLTALESLAGAGLSFVRHPIAVWDNIWLAPASSQYDIAGGGITILDSRTRDASGKKKVSFTSGHIAFRQSLLVRVEDAQRLASYDDLGNDVRIGAIAGTTGEARLLQLTGLANAHGVLVSGTRIDTPAGAVIADGSADYFITAATASANLIGRQHIHPPVATMPQVIYLGEQSGEAELFDALAANCIDAIARGGTGNHAYAQASQGALVVTALDSQTELGGFTLAVKDSALRACLDEKINLLTDNRHIGYAEWLQDPQVFMRRAEIWNNQH